jgi:hypothetical protein
MDFLHIPLFRRTYSSGRNLVSVFPAWQPEMRERAILAGFLSIPKRFRARSSAGNHGLIEEQSRHPGGCFDDFPPRLN